MSIKPSEADGVCNNCACGVHDVRIQEHEEA